MTQDSLQFYCEIDSSSYKIQKINDQFTKTDKITGSSFVGLWLLGAIFTFLIFKRPNSK